jgi:ATP-binding cassette subfamily B protein
VGDIGRLFSSLWQLIRGQDQRGRKVRWMIGLLRPYRGKVALMFVALLVATGAGLAPPYLAGQAVDNGIITGDVSALDLIVVAFVVVATLYAAATCASGSSPTCRRCRSASSPVAVPAC